MVRIPSWPTAGITSASTVPMMSSARLTAACTLPIQDVSASIPAVVEMAFNSVHRIRPDGTVDCVIPNFDYPNGLAFSPDERLLYVANTRPGQYIMVYDVHADGTVSHGRRFADMPSPDATNGVPDGMKVDVEGRVYCTGPGGCWVFDPAGTLIGIIRLPEYPANCAWGGPDNQTMFFTANTSIYSLRMTTPGTRIPRA